MTIRTYISWLLGMTRGMRGMLATRVAIGICRVAVMLAFVFICKQTIDTATTPGWSMPLTPLIAAMIGCLAAQLLLTAAGSRIAVATSGACANRMRLEMFDRTMNATYGQRLHSADIIERMKKDTDTVTDLICNALPTSVITAIQLLAAFAFLAVLDWRLGLILVAIMPAALIIGKAFIRKMRRMTRQLRQTDTAAHRHILEHMRHRDVDAAFQATTAAINRLDRLQLRLYRLMLRRNNCSLFSRTMVQAGFSAGYATAFIWGVYGLHTQAITFGVMTAFLQLVAQVQRPAVELAGQIPGFIYGIASAERIAPFIGTPSTTPFISPDDSANPAVGSNRNAFGNHIGIRLSQLTFQYADGEAPILTGLSHDFIPGSMTAVTGATGIGKTTLMRLLLALVKPTGGAITFYDNNGNSAEATAATRSYISFVPQGNTLISGTIRANLRMADPEADDAMLRNVLIRSAAGFVFDLPAGIDTRIGESGLTLSEGQAQRIAIARGLLRDAPVMLLDEPTSALDPATEESILKELAQLSTTGKTVIVITHRKATAAACPHHLHLS